MPTGMPGNTMRGHVIKQIERVINNCGEDALKILIEDLSTQKQPMVKILTNTYGGQRALDPSKEIDKFNKRHLRVDWFGRHRKRDPKDKDKKIPVPPQDWRGRWWRGTTRRTGYQPIDPIVRLGLWTTCKLKLKLQGESEDAVPIHMVWICAGHHFEVHSLPQYLVDSDGKRGAAHGISVLIVTPHEGLPLEDAGMSEVGSDVSADIDDEIYIVRGTLVEDDESRAGYARIEKWEGSDAVPTYYDDAVTKLPPAALYNPLKQQDPF